MSGTHGTDHRVAASTEATLTGPRPTHGSGSRPERSGREALLDATITVIARKGLRQLTYRTVAREAGVAPSLISHHFGSIDALIAAAVGHSLSRSVLDTATLSGPAGFLSAVPELTGAMADLQLFQLEMTLESARDERLRPLVRDLHRHYTDATRVGLAGEGIETEDFAALVLALIDGLALRQLTVGTEQESQRALGVLRLLLSLYVEQGVEAPRD